jgi:hypothetical protein
MSPRTHQKLSPKLRPTRNSVTQIREIGGCCKIAGGMRDSSYSLIALGAALTLELSPPMAGCSKPEAGRKSFARMAWITRRVVEC